MSSKPDYTAERRTRQTIVRAWTRVAIADGKVSTCLNCDHWEANRNGGGVTRSKAGDAETCTKYAMRPPATIIAHGCEQWEEDIPF